MRRTMLWCVGWSAAGVIGTAWAMAQQQAPVDALRPENDVVSQLQQRVAGLEARVAELEQRMFNSPTVPATLWKPTPMPPRFADPQAPLPPSPKAEEHETNGVKYRFFLLGSEGAPSVPR